MPLTNCKVVNCKNQKPERSFVCSTCWNKIPVELRMEINLGGEKGSKTLRINPSKNWIEKAIQYTGLIKVPYIMGTGITAVKLAADKSEI